MLFSSLSSLQPYLSLAIVTSLFQIPQCIDPNSLVELSQWNKQELSPRFITTLLRRMCGKLQGKFELKLSNPLVTSLCVSHVTSSSLEKRVIPTTSESAQLTAQEKCPSGIVRLNIGYGPTVGYVLGKRSSQRTTRVSLMSALLCTGQG